MFRKFLNKTRGLWICIAFKRIRKISFPFSVEGQTFPLKTNWLRYVITNKGFREEFASNLSSLKLLLQRWVKHNVVKTIPVLLSSLYLLAILRNTFFLLQNHSALNTKFQAEILDFQSKKHPEKLFVKWIGRLIKQRLNNKAATNNHQAKKVV